MFVCQYIFKLMWQFLFKHAILSEQVIVHYLIFQSIISTHILDNMALSLLSVHLSWYSHNKLCNTDQEECFHISSDIITRISFAIFTTADSWSIIYGDMSLVVMRD